MQILDGKAVAAAVKNAIKEKATELKIAGQKAPHLAAILVGNDGASETYVASKVKSCKEVGFTSTLIRLAENVDENILLQTIEQLNADADIDGILLQFPLPQHIN